MATQLLVNVLEVTVPALGSVTVSHGLKSNNKAVVPTLIQPDRATPVYVIPSSVTDTEVTFENPDTSAQTAKFRFERGLSNEVEADDLPVSYWQGNTGGGGGGGSVTFADLGLVTYPAPPASPIAAGTPVAIVAGALVPANAASIAAAPAVGIYDGAAGTTVRTSGSFLGLAGLPNNTRVYLAVGGGITATPPSGAGRVVQALGYTRGTTTLFVDLSDPTIL